MKGTNHLTMRRFAFSVIGIGSLVAALLGCTGNNTDPSVLLGLRSDPAIIPNGPATDSFQWSFSVDLSSYPDAASVSWDFGDGSTTTARPISSGRTVGHTFTRAGTFNVQVHLFNAGNPLSGTPQQVIGTGKLPVDVTGPNTGPTASFLITDAHDDTNTVIPNRKHFNGAGSRDPDGSIAKYEWDFGDGATGEGVTIEHTYSTGGRYLIRLTVTDNRGATADATQNELVNTAPVAAFTFSVSPSDNVTVTFNGSGSSDPDGTISQYSWQFGDGNTGNGDTPVHTYASAGTFNVTLTVTDSLGGTNSVSQSVHAPGTLLLVNGASPDFGVVNTTVGSLRITGENFQANGLGVTLERGSNILNPTNVSLVNSSALDATFDLTNATLGDYDVVVVVAGSQPRRLTNGFRVGTANRVRLTTTMGDIVLELVADAPLTTANFLQYVTDHFYDGTIFHRVVPGFVVQGGGFLPGNVRQTGVRGPIQNEFSPNRSNIRGTVAMAKLGNDPNSATCEFFFNLVDNSQNLDNQNGGFTVFANVVVGLDVMDAMAGVPLTGEVPTTDIVLTRARRE